MPPTSGTVPLLMLILMQEKGWSEKGLLSMLSLVDNLPSHGSWSLPDLPVPPEQIPIRCNISHSRHQCTVQPARTLSNPAPTQPIAQHLILLTAPRSALSSS